MNKWLIRNVKPSTKNMAPQAAAKLVRMIESRTRGAKTRQEAEERIQKLLAETLNGLRGRGMSTERALERVAIIGAFALTWIDLTFALLLASFSPAILLLVCLASTLDENLVPERRDFTFEEIKQSLLDRHWPPQRQRCDFVAASAY
ncbi:MULTISPECIES: hypothetical protein [unclassified Microcoleus]|uniref:hypothetical protein n=1 Tax=unclassified Microcoleus TaxID=2642155 RepID=UPI002FCF1B9B